MRLVVQKHVIIGLLSFEKKAMANLPHLPLRYFIIDNVINLMYFFKKIH